jgi:integrase
VSYRIRVELGDDPVTGTRRQPSRTYATRKQADAALAEWVREVQLGTAVHAEKMTVAQYLERWQETLLETVRSSTQRRYRDLLHKHVIPVIGDIKLSKLSPLDVQRVYADRLSKGLAPGTVLMIHNVLHKALRQALRWGMVPRNVAELTDPPKTTPTEYHSWSAEQVADFLAVADADDYAALWRLSVLTGLRRGELLGLKWGDLDLHRGSLAVRRTRSRTASGNWGVGAPKTRSSNRSVALPQSVVEALRAHRTTQLEHRLAVGSLYQDQGFVFTTPEGRPLHVNSLLLRFNRLTTQAKLPRLRFHDLRHTSATLSLANGTHPKIVQERLGHSSISITLDRYSHATVDMQRDAAERLDRMISRQAQKPQDEGKAKDY